MYLSYCIYLLHRNCSPHVISYTDAANPQMFHVPRISGLAVAPTVGGGDTFVFAIQVLKDNTQHSIFQSGATYVVIIHSIERAL